MQFEMWWFWFGLAAVFIVGEVFTQGFFLLWFGIGALVAGLLELVGAGPGLTWSAFVVVSAVLLLISRRFAERFTKKQPPGIGADRLIGRRGVVLSQIDNERNTGEVRIDKEIWRAESEDDDVIPAGTRVEVVRLEGTHAMVRPLKKEKHT
jgi:inner membrane protein